MATFKTASAGAALILMALILMALSHHAAFAEAPAASSLHAFAEVSLSPNRALIASVESDQPLAPTTMRPRGPVVVRDRRTGEVAATYDPCPACRYAGLTWSPDGAALAFIATDAGTGHADLDVVRGGQSRVLASLEGVAQTPRFSPDGTLIALMATPGAHKETGAVEAGARLVGDIDALTVADEKRIAVLPVTGGPPRYVSPSDTFIYEYDWRPDGRGFVATGAKGNGDDNWWIAKLIAVDLDGSPARIIAAPDIQINAPRVSPDGRAVVFIGGLMSDFGSVGGDVYSAPFAGGAPRTSPPGSRPPSPH